MIKFKNSEITPENIYKKRRSFIKSIGLGAGSLAISTIPFVNKSLASGGDKLTSYKDITTYNIIMSLEHQRVTHIEILKHLKLHHGKLVLRGK